MENQVEDPVKYRDELVAAKNDCKLLRERVRIQKKMNDQQLEQIAKLTEEFDYVGRINQLKEEIAQEKTKWHENSRKRTKDHKNYGKKDNMFNDELMRHERLRHKLRSDQLTLLQVKREKAAAESQMGTISRFNPDYEDPMK